MAEETTTTAATTEQTTTTTEDEQRVPYERFQKANQTAKEAKAQATALQKQLDEVKAQMEERESAGLPELERERKRAEALEKRAAEAEKRAEENERKLVRSGREALVRQAAQAANFDDPGDALRYPEHVDLDAIESAADAERAVKQLAKAKPRLIKDEAPALPGRVLENGKATTSNGEKATFTLDEEAKVIQASLKEFLASRGR